MIRRVAADRTKWLQERAAFILNRPRGSKRLSKTEQVADWQAKLANPAQLAKEHQHDVATWGSVKAALRLARWDRDMAAMNQSEGEPDAS